MNIYDLEQLKKYIGYESSTGRLFWRVGLGYRPKGSDAGGSNTGRITIYLKGKRYKAEEVAWYLTYGAWPAKKVIFKNKNRGDLRLSNLTLDSRKVNEVPSRGQAMITQVDGAFEIQDNMSYPPRLIRCDSVDVALLELAKIIAAARVEKGGGGIGAKRSVC